MTTMTLDDALASLDSGVDDHWTTDGQPKISYVSGLVGRQVTRTEITEAAPQLTRDTATVPEAAPEPVKEPTLEEKIGDAKDRRKAAQVAFAAAQADLAAMEDEVTRLEQEHYEATFQPQDNAALIRAYLDRQKKNKAAAKGSSQEHRAPIDVDASNRRRPDTGLVPASPPAE